VLPSVQHSVGQVTQMFESGGKRSIHTHFQVFLESCWVRNCHFGVLHRYYERCGL